MLLPWFASILGLWTGLCFGRSKRFEQTLLGPMIIPGYGLLPSQDRCEVLTDFFDNLVRLLTDSLFSVVKMFYKNVF